MKTAGGTLAARVQVIFFGEIVAESRDAILRFEADGVPVYYFRRRDVKMERLFKSTRTSLCPLKGEAMVYTLVNGRLSEHAAWSYEEPREGASEIKDRIAFDPAKVDEIRVVPGES